MKKIQWMILATLLSLPVNVSYSADQSFCEKYSNDALDQFRQAQAAGCRDLKYPVWSMDYGHHYDWCIKTQEADVSAGGKFRQDLLDKCKSAAILKNISSQKYYQTKESTCTSYAQKAVAQNNMKEEHNCYLLNGPKWNSKYEDHYNWCVHGENVKYAEPGNKERDIALDRCMNPRYHIEVTLDQVDVHDDCDNVSMGEWALALIVEGKDLDGNAVHETRQWPGRSTATTVDTGSSIYPKTSISLLNMHGKESITISMVGIECDGDIFGPYYESWSLSDWGNPINCDKYEEEFPEVSGANDSMGKTTLTLSPLQWEVGGLFMLKAPLNTPCSDKSPYTAFIKLTSTQKAYAPPGLVK